MISAEKLKYLPFSYPFVKNFLCCSQKEENDILNDLLKRYFQFIVSTVCIQKIYSGKKELENPYEVHTNNQHKEFINNLVRKDEFQSGINYHVILKNNMADNVNPTIDDSNVFAFPDDENALRTWVDKFSSPLSEYSVYYIKIGA